MYLTELLESLQEAQKTLPDPNDIQVRFMTDAEIEIQAIFSQEEGNILWVQMQGLQLPIPEIKPLE
jgi:hypothetical protein